MERMDKYETARMQIEKEKSFYTHLIIYTLVIGAFWALNAMNDQGDWWAFWPTVGWGIGLFFHGFGVFGKNAVFGKRWEEKRMKELMDEK